MAVRPVDSLTMVPRLNEAGRHVHQHEQQPYAFQHALGSSMQERAQRERTQVRQKEKTEQPTIRQDGRRGQGGQGQQARGERQARTAETSQSPTATGHPGRLDVKV